MSNSTQNIQPPDQDKDPTVSNVSSSLDGGPRKKATPTPSQVGSFLSALESRKIENKTAKSSSIVSSKDSDEEGDSTEGTQGLFGLVGSATKKLKGSFDDGSASNEEESAAGMAAGLGQAQASMTQQTAQSSSTPSGQGNVGKIAMTDTTLDKPDMGVLTQTPQAQMAARNVFKDLPPVEPHKANSTDEGDVSSVSTNAAAGHANAPPLLSLTAQAVLHDEAVQTQQSASDQRAQMVQLITAIADHITTLQAQNLTSTQILLKNPPIFEGATLTINEYSSAKNEFNITFQGLSPDARRLIESTPNQQLLQSRLLEQGYTLRMITIDASIQLAEAQAQGQSGGSEKGRHGEDETGGQGNRPRRDEGWSQDETVI